MNPSTRRKMVAVLAVPSLLVAALMAASPGSALAPRNLSSIAIHHAPPAHLTTSPGVWAPTTVAPPSVLPSGLSVLSEQLNATSCSSSAFCVTVGYVTDMSYNNFPLVDTYAGGAWTSALVSTPTNIEPGFWNGSLSGVSCPADGECIAVGLYDSYDPTANTGYQDPLLANLANGSWTSIQGGMPLGVPHGLFNVSSVSCPTPTFCSAAGTYSYNSNLGMIWDWSPAGWSTSEVPISDPSIPNMQVLAISCSDVNDCVATGTYTDTAYVNRGLILTYTSGVWTAIQAPLPTNANIANSGSGTRLYAVDCPQVDSCIAVGTYPVTPQVFQPLIEELNSGVWSPVEGPLPADAAAGASGILSGAYCPTEGSCIATGGFGGANGWFGMILTQSGSTWSAADAPLPPGLVSSIRMKRAQDFSTTTGSSLTGVGCASSGFCASGGTDGTTGLVETGQLIGIPTVASITPNVGATGSVVTVSGSNFSPTSLVQFDGTAASTTFVSMTELQAVVPSTVRCGSLITVSTGGFATRSEQSDAFTRAGCSTPSAPLNVKAVPGNARAWVSFTPPSSSGGEAVTAYVVTANDLTSSSRGGQVVRGTSSHTVVGGLMPGDRYTFTVTASNTVGSGPASLPSAPVSLPHVPITIVTTALRAATIGPKYAAFLKATGGFGTFTWKVTAGALPKGIHLSTSGQIFGTVPSGTLTGRYSFRATVTDLHLPAKDSASATFVLTVT